MQIKLTIIPDYGRPMEIEASSLFSDADTRDHRLDALTLADARALSKVLRKVLHRLSTGPSIELEPIEMTQTFAPTTIAGHEPREAYDDMVGKVTQ